MAMANKEAKSRSSCPSCGGTKFTVGRVYDIKDFWFLPDGASTFTKLTTQGEPVRARKCEACGHLMLFADVP